MGNKLEHSFENGILTIYLVGDYSIQEILDRLESCFNEYASGKPIGVLIDATRSQSNRSLEEIRRYMPQIEKWKDRVLGFAVLVASDFLFGLTNQASAYAEISGLELRPFRDPDEAISWIQEKVG